MESLSRTWKITFVILVVIALGAVAVAGIFFFKYTNTPSATPKQDELSQVISEVGKVLLLPSNETPTLATVSNPAVLKNQPFFANALAGDKVLIYPTSKKAILWRPSTKQVIEVATVDINIPNPTQ